MNIKSVTLILSAMLATANAFGGAGIVWFETTHDFGAFHESEGPATAVFRFVNVGDEPIVITGARANCGCTTPRFSTQPIAPGDTASVSVAYDPAGRPGRFSKKVYVDTSSEPRRSTLTITGVVVGAPESLAGRYPVQAGDFRMAHPAALLGTVARSHVKSVFESIYNASTDTIRPVVSDIPAWLDVRPVPQTLPPGEQGSLNFYVRSNRIPDWDMVVDTISVRPFAESSDVVRMPVVITVTEDFSTLSDKQRAHAPIAVISTRRLEPATTGSTVTFTVRNDGRSPLRLRRLYTAHAGITTDVRPDDTVKPGKSRTVSIHIDPDALSPGSPADVANLILITNDPAAPKTLITLPITH